MAFLKLSLPTISGNRQYPAGIRLLNPAFALYFRVGFMFQYIKMLHIPAHNAQGILFFSL